MKWLNGQSPDDISDISQGEDVGDLVRSFMEQGSDLCHDNGEDGEAGVRSTT